RMGAFSKLEAGTGAPILMLHGLGGTKASFLPTIAALAPSFRTIAVDLLGFGDSDKPLGASYGPDFQARGIVELLDALELVRTHPGRRLRSTNSCAPTRPRAVVPPSMPPRATSISTSRTATMAFGPVCARFRRSRSSYGGVTTRSCRSASRDTSSRYCRQPA